jgi:hypothetical protein
VNSYAIEDLTPFFADGCWMFVLLARNAAIGVILRRGPSKWWRVTLWDTRRDRFEGGQWFRGRIYPHKCDLSPDGKLLIYFAGKFRPRDVEKGYHYTWTAVSRPPYMAALALWPIGDTWGGHGVFLDDRTLLLATSAPSFGARHHPDHPPGPLRVVEYCSMEKDDPRRDAAPCWRNGWQGTLADAQPNRSYPRYSAWRKRSGGLVLEREAKHRDVWGGMEYEGYLPYPSRRRARYTLYRQDGEPVALFEAHWADWDQEGRLVATVGGRVLDAKITKDGELKWRQLAAMNDEQPERMEAPKWAQKWQKKTLA